MLVIALKRLHKRNTATALTNEIYLGERFGEREDLILQ
jgi:hypothetical protein